MSPGETEPTLPPGTGVAPDADPRLTPRRAVSRSLWLIERKQRTVKEIGDYLLRHEYPREVVAEALERLLRMGVLNDAAYAEQFITGSAPRKGYGRGRIALELRRRGVDAALVEESLAEYLDPEQEERLLEKLARRRFGELRRAGVEGERLRARLTAHLVRKGFSAGAVLRLARELEAEEAAASREFP
ncbi:MAG: regulatory protein RecX [Candidatus Geothermincolia bacterium]